MTGVSPVTTIDGFAWQSHVVLVRIVVTGLAPVMPTKTCFSLIASSTIIILTRIGRNELPPLPLPIEKTNVQIQVDMIL